MYRFYLKGNDVMKKQLKEIAEYVFGREIAENENLFTVEAGFSIDRILYFFLEIERNFKINIAIDKLEDGAFYSLDSIYQMLLDLCSKNDES